MECIIRRVVVMLWRFLILSHAYQSVFFDAGESGGSGNPEMLVSQQSRCVLGERAGRSQPVLSGTCVSADPNDLKTMHARSSSPAGRVSTDVFSALQPLCLASPCMLE